MQLVIDSSFVKKWHPQYDLIEHDEPEYSSIADAVRKTLASTDSFPIDLFVRILDWKAARVKGKIRWHEYESYSERILQSQQMSENARLPLLCTLYGIGVPVGSTILHFLSPATTPIMDIRTVETLHEAGLIKHKSRTLNSFVPFKNAIVDISVSCPQWSLRQIDRALFAYHKLNERRVFIPRNEDLSCKDEAT